MKFFIDIETIPSQLGWVKEEIAESITAPGNYKKEESIQKWLEENLESETDKELRKTAFDAAVGHIICIGISWEEGDKVFYAETPEAEKQVLQNFFSFIATECERADHGHNNPYFVGHNIRNFDLPYLWRRAKVLDVRPGFKFGFDGRHGQDFYDTMLAWTGAYAKSYSGASLARLCKIMGIEVKSGMDGSQVYDAWLEGKHKEIRDYCMEDVNATHKLYERLIR